MTPEDFYTEINRVEPGLIRVEADEVTYPLHIILRFELEKALLNGEVSVSDLPTVWKTKMKESLGVEVPDDTKGVLQDVHWPVCAIGYFPSYTLGAMMAAQLYAHAHTDIPTLEKDISEGKFSGLREWLREKVHVSGSKCESLDELLVSVTGKKLDPKIFMRYLREKYGALYNLKGKGGKEEL